MAAVPTVPAYEWRTVLRHRAPLRWMHWINLACMLALVASLSGVCLAPQWV